MKRERESRLRDPLFRAIRKAAQNLVDLAGDIAPIPGQGTDLRLRITGRGKVKLFPPEETREETQEDTRETQETKEEKRKGPLPPDPGSPAASLSWLGGAFEEAVHRCEPGEELRVRFHPGYRQFEARSQFRFRPLDGDGSTGSFVISRWGDSPSQALDRFNRVVRKATTVMDRHREGEADTVARIREIVGWGPGSVPEEK